MRASRPAGLLAGCAAAVVFGSCAAQDSAAHAHSSLQPAQTVDLRFHQHMGTALPLGAEFRDSAGRPVTLGEFFRGEPVVVILEYLRCRSLCSYVLKDTVSALSQVPLVSGRDYQVVAISIDPRDRPADARMAQAMYLGSSGSDSSLAGWHFLTGSAAPIHAVARAVGFSYRYDAAIDQFAHPAGITIATPGGIIARYILGVGYRPLDLRLALAEASLGHVSSPVADLLLLCYCYDPGTGRYSLAISNITRALCALTLLAMAASFVKLIRARGS